MRRALTWDHLKYIADTLDQMAMTLRDFELQESAQLLDKAKSDIHRKLAERGKKGVVQA